LHAWNHRSSSVLSLGGDSHRQRGSTNRDCKRVLHAETSAAGIATCRNVNGGFGCAPGQCQAGPIFLRLDLWRHVFLDRYHMVLVGGGFGALMRYIISLAIAGRIGGRFPLGTLVINVTGSFLIGVLMTLSTGWLQAH